MAKKRKLQIFVSSTYTDLKEERQAAVEAILKAGHIPAGMELFAATDRSQMDVIKKWIDESDAYILLLGGRYGSVEPDSGKSYTQLEYEYAIEKGKAHFSIVISDERLDQKVAQHGKEVLELKNPSKYDEFRSVVTSKLVEFWSDLRDIKLAIHTTLSEFSDRPELVGWIPGNEATNTGMITEQIARLSKENDELRQQLIISQSNNDPIRYDGLTYNQLYSHLNSEPFTGNLIEEDREPLNIIVSFFGDSQTSLLHVFFYLDASPSQNRPVSLIPSGMHWASQQLIQLGLITVNKDVDTSRKTYGTEQPQHTFRSTPTGHQFMLRLKVEKETVKLNKILGAYYEDRAVG